MREHACPLCSDTHEAESDLRIHLEVEHRKSELAALIVEHSPHSRDPIADHDTESTEGTPTVRP